MSIYLDVALAHQRQLCALEEIYTLRIALQSPFGGIVGRIQTLEKKILVIGIKVLKLMTNLAKPVSVMVGLRHKVRASSLFEWIRETHMPDTRSGLADRPHASSN